MNSLQIAFLIVAIISLITYSLYARFKPESKIANKGYDLVAYFETNRALKGKKEYSHFYKSKTYYFSSQNNKETFTKNPKYYLPQYDGYCAYGMSGGYKAKTQPKAFTIFEDKLYLNYSLKYREVWRKDKEEKIKKADDNWANLYRNSK